MEPLTNQWTKRRSILYTCKSGQQVMVRRIGPSLGLKAQRFLSVVKKLGDGKVDEQLQRIIGLPDHELERLTQFAEIVLADTIVQPVIVMNPKEGQIGPSDIPLADFWEVFMYVSSGCPEMPVETKEGETTIEAVSSFPESEARGAPADTGSETVQ